MTKNDLVNAVAAHGLSKRQSSSVVESVFDIIFRCFEKGEDVKIVGFGHFRIRRKASRRGRNPQTGQSIEITARRVLEKANEVYAWVSDLFQVKSRRIRAVAESTCHLKAREVSLRAEADMNIDGESVNLG